MAKKWEPVLFKPPPARLYIAVSFDDPDIFFKIKKELVSQFGKIDYESNSLPTDGLTPLYNVVPRRTFRLLSFQRMIAREELVDIRKKTLTVESAHQHEGFPLLELDPGYITEYAAVRSAIEDDFHRIYLFHGISAETLYYFQDSSFVPTPHTPKFYQNRDTITFFNDLRLIHATELGNL